MKRKRLKSVAADASETPDSGAPPQTQEKGADFEGILVILFVLILVGIGSAVSCRVKQYNQSAKKKDSGKQETQIEESLYSWNLWILRMCFICPSKV